MISQKDVDSIVNIIVSNFNPDKIILFGSYAYGQPNEDSDLDLLIIKNVGIEKHKRGREIRKYLRGTKIPIDLLVYSNEEFQELKYEKSVFLTQIIEKGKVLYEKEWQK